MHPQLQSALNDYRFHRRFDSARYLSAKSTLLNTYFEQSKINGCVVGVSGGVDSALTLGIVAHAAKQPGSPIKKILAVLLPMYAEGATHQKTASSRGAEVAVSLDIHVVTIDLSASLEAARKASFVGTGVRGDSWSAGQLVSYMRTPMLYYQAALLAEQGVRSVVCGTTNRDEGSYIGFFGKASDGMVDIQPISDIHKSEVYQLAKLVELPESVCSAAPTGDTYDGMCDEQMIGASYDAVELYEWYLCTNVMERQAWRKSLCAEADNQFAKFEFVLEKLHQTNQHKYIGDSPAVHLDVWDRVVPGGWRSQSIQAFTAPGLREAALAARVGPFELSEKLKEILRGNKTMESLYAEHIADFGDSAVLVRNILTSEECTAFLNDIATTQWIPADQNGRPMVEPIKKIIGSYRATAFDEELAQLLWSRIRLVLPSVRMFTKFASTDWKGHPVWRPIGVNPMLRFIRYETGGALVPHYDAGYDYNDGHRHTLMSVVLTLKSQSQALGGNTRLLIDPQRYLSLEERNFADNSSMALSRESLANVNARPGDALVFDHRLRHDAPSWYGAKSRIILRTDIIFERCAPHALKEPKYAAEAAIASESGIYDPTYRKAFDSLGSMAALRKAGYLDEGLQQGLLVDPRWWTATYDKILKRLCQTNENNLSQELFVLVTTGGLCPIHLGHLEMMEHAKQELESRGKLVVGGYFALDNDDYVQSKCGRTSISAYDRIALCERAVSQSDWLMVDRWAALYPSTIVNFTTVVDRIQCWLNFYTATHRPIQVAYVFGSDNARFAAAFIGRGSCVCVLRPGYETELDEVRSDMKIYNNDRIILSHNKTFQSSSSRIRQGELAALPELVKEEWLRLKAIKSLPKDGADSENESSVNLYMRREGSWAIKPWTELPNACSTQIHEAYSSFCEGLHDVFNRTFEKSIGERQVSPRVDVVFLDLEDQAVSFKHLSQSKNIISLDPCLPGTANFCISRCFEPVTNHFLGFVARPGADSIDHQLEQISNVSSVLFDDDVASGQTAAYAQSLLRSRCTIEDFVTLCDESGPRHLDQPQGHQTRLDNLDCRDFLVGAREAGLVLRLPNNELCRAPYLLPYVSPHYRASVPATQEIAFSKAVWALNKSFFSALSLNLRISNMSHAYQTLCANQGFNDSMEMKELCDWHLKQLGE